KKIKFTIISYFFIFIGVIFSSILIQITDYIITKYTGFSSIIALFHESRIEVDKFSIYKIIFIIPLIEEILFRLFLIPKKLNLIISSSFIIFFIINKNFFNIDLYSYKPYLSTLIIFSIIFLIHKKYLFIKEFLLNKKKIITYLSIISFALVHISNIHVFHWQLSLLYPIYVLPQLVMGYFITNLRLKTSFIWGVILHVLINSIGSFVF
uniref:hypothetical protein n=1 Tax=Empedobacter stercoris TaxID=1628248 RepID=UPI0039E9E435